MQVHQSLINQAKQGDATAIAQLMQAPLVGKGITVHTQLKNGCLHVDLVASSCPPKKASLSFIRNGVAHLNPEGIRAVRIDGYQAGLSEPGWVSRFNLHDNEKELAAITSSTTAKRKPGGLTKRLFFLAGVGIVLLAALGIMNYLNSTSSSNPPAEVTAPAAQP